MPMSTGAHTVIERLLAGGVDVCFANPGTSEMHFVAALDASPGMRAVLCLFEGVATEMTPEEEALSRSTPGFQMPAA